VDTAHARTANNGEWVADGNAERNGDDDDDDDDDDEGD
jgi:hypothetical protein